MAKPRKTNIEFIVDAMEFSAYGALSQAFIMEAVSKYANVVAASKPEDFPKSGFIQPEVWISVGKEIQAKLRLHYGNTVMPPELKVNAVKLVTEELMAVGDTMGVNNLSSDQWDALTPIQQTALRGLSAEQATLEASLAASVKEKTCTMTNAFHKFEAWSVEDLKNLKKVYAAAVKHNHESLGYQGSTFLVGYAKYVIEYLESLPKFKP